MIIDSHQHFWRLERGDYGWLTSELEPIYRDFNTEDLRPLLSAQGVAATIAVQAAPTEAETAFLLWLAEQNDWILGVVGWVDLEAKTAAKRISAAAQNPKLLGLRPMIQDIDDDNWMLQTALSPAFEAMVTADLTFDALVLPKHLRVLSEFLERYPNLRVVVDHCAKPEIRSNGFEPWAEHIARVAEFPNTFCKVSGLFTEARPDQTAEDLKPYVHHVLDVFGPTRCLWGSDWPVLNLAADYASWFDAFSAITANLDDTQRLAVFSETAQKAYPRLRHSLASFNHSKQPL